MAEMEKRDVLIALFWILLGLTISIWSSTFPFGAMKKPGPAFFPFALGLILMFLGGVLFFRTITRKGQRSKRTVVPLVPEGEGFARVAFTLGGMLLSAVLFNVFGFIVTIFCLILLLMRAIEPQKWRVDLFYVLVFTLGSYMLFQVLLKVTLPHGFLGF